MQIANRWQDYEILDCSSGERLERWGDYILIRPDPQVLWDTAKKDDRWNHINAHYHRSSSGGGKWDFYDLPHQWTIDYELPSSVKSKIRFNLKPFSFKHTGVFPEQAYNWDRMSEVIAMSVKRGRQVKILNLFAYTGGATLACVAAGAHVTHVDASKGMVSWAKDNAISSNLPETSFRWIVDDCLKFIKRELRRGNHYDGIIMDPPSYGRGPGGEIWKIEDGIYELVLEAAKLLSDDALFFLISSYTTGLQPGVLTYILSSCIDKKLLADGDVISDEIGLPVSSSHLYLPCGASGIYINNKNI